MWSNTVLALALSLLSSTGASPVQHAPRETKPVLNLPYGSFEATEKRSGIWTFKNIPYAQPPLGDLRWARPQPPKKMEGVQGGSRRGPACLQAGVYGPNVLGDGNGSDLGKLVNQIIGNTESILDANSEEDCLYLDLQVPEKAIRNPSLRLPVVVYLYGGAFVLGDKDVLQPLLPFYDGSGMIKQSGGDIIFISFNYRVGALGFLAGSTMEREGLANAGLWDQRAVFQWVQSHISKVGGDPEQVTAMGESSGASSILFHLVANGGTLDPLFRRAILMSPAYQPMWDRSGLVEDKFQQFATLAGCGGKGVSCLRKVNSNKLKEANRQLMKQQRPGTFAVGPTPDGSFIRQLPTVELQAGKVWPIDSVVLSYCAHESLLFASRSVRSDAGFEEFIHDIFPNYTVSSGLTGKVLDFYPPVGTGGGQFYSQPKRLEAFLRDSCFTCNVRYLAEALGSSKVWVMKYGVAPGWHGTDLVPAFFNEDFNMDSLMEFLASLVHIVAGLFLRGLSRAYQSYFASYASTGDPNQERLSLWNNLPYPGTVEWKRPSFAGENVGGVLKVDYGLFNFFQMVDDDQMPRAACEFWKDFARAVTLDGGYTPASRP